MEIDEIRRRLAKPASRLVACPPEPQDDEHESWIGRVLLYRPDESLPLSDSGEEMVPLAQLHLDGLPHVSPRLEGVSVLTLFMSRRFPQPEEPMGRNWLIREYRADETLVRKDLAGPPTKCRPHVLFPKAVEEDFPIWDSGTISDDLTTAILDLEEEGVIECYYDIAPHEHDHKVGGYPSFCQGGRHPGPDFEFVFQISSDREVGLNVVDNGSFMFWKNVITGEWWLYYDYM